MRLDHLLSKEQCRKGIIARSDTRVRALFDFEGTSNGGVAQLGEHLLCKQGVRSSILLISTKRGRIAQVVRAHA